MEFVESTNYGRAALDMFCTTHVCNDVCRLMHLPTLAVPSTSGLRDRKRRSNRGLLARVANDLKGKSMVGGSLGSQISGYQNPMSDPPETIAEEDHEDGASSVTVQSFGRDGENDGHEEVQEEEYVEPPMCVISMEVIDQVRVQGISL